MRRNQHATNDVLHSTEVTDHDVVAESSGDHVFAEAAKDRHGPRRIGGVDRVVVACGTLRDLGQDRWGVWVIGGRPATGVHDQEAIIAGLKIDGDLVVAQTGVQHRRRATTSTKMGAIDGDRVAARPGPIHDTVEQIAGRIDQVRDATRRQRRRAASQPGHKDLCAGRELTSSSIGRRNVRDRHGGVGHLGRLVADEQAVSTRAEIDVQGAVDIVEVTGQEVEARSRSMIEIGSRRHEYPIVTAAERNVGDRNAAGSTEASATCSRSLHVEDLGTRAGRDVHRFEPEVGDAIHGQLDVDARRIGARGHERACIGEQHVGARWRVGRSVRFFTQGTLHPDQIHQRCAVGVGHQETIDSEVDIEHAGRVALSEHRLQRDPHGFCRGVMSEGRSGLVCVLHAVVVDVVPEGKRSAGRPNGHGNPVIASRAAASLDPGRQRRLGENGRHAAAGKLHELDESGGIGGDFGHVGVGQIALEPQHIDVVVLGNREVVVADAAERTERRFDLASARVVRKSAGGLATEAQRERAPHRINHDSLDLVRLPNRQAVQRRRREQCPRVGGVTGVIDIEGVFVAGAVRGRGAVRLRFVAADHQMAHDPLEGAAGVDPPGCVGIAADLEHIVLFAAVQDHRALQTQHADPVDTDTRIDDQQAARVRRADNHVVVGVTGVENDRAADVLDDDRITTSTRGDVGDTAMRRNHVEEIALGAQRNIERLERAVVDAIGHAETADRCRCERARIRCGVAGVIDVERVIAVVAFDGQQCADRVERSQSRRCVAADIDGVVAVAGPNRGRTTDGSHIDRVGATVGPDLGFAAGRQNSDRVGVVVPQVKDAIPIEDDRIVGVGRRRIRNGILGQRAATGTFKVLGILDQWVGETESTCAAVEVIRAEVVLGCSAVAGNRIRGQPRGAGVGALDGEHDAIDEGENVERLEVFIADAERHLQAGQLGRREGAWLR